MVGAWRDNDPADRVGYYLGFTDSRDGQCDGPGPYLTYQAALTGAFAETLDAFRDMQRTRPGLQVQTNYDRTRFTVVFESGQRREFYVKRIGG